MSRLTDDLQAPAEGLSAGNAAAYDRLVKAVETADAETAAATMTALMASAEMPGAGLGG